MIKFLIKQPRSDSTDNLPDTAELKVTELKQLAQKYLTHSHGKNPVPIFNSRDLL